MEILVRPLSEDDSRDVAAIHKKVFADAPSSRLGHWYCRKLYGLYATEDNAFGHVLSKDGELVGFVVGGDIDAHERISGKLRKQALLAGTVRPGMLIDRVVKAMTKRPKSKPRDQNLGDAATKVDRKATSKLFLIGILEKARGTGGAARLLNAFVSTAFSRNFDTVVLTVHRDNSRARAAYEKAGWIPTDRGGESVEYRASRSK